MPAKRAPIQGYPVEESVEFGFDAYVRISKEKDDNTTSLLTQREEIRQHCRENGIPLGLIFEEDFTGALLYERKVLMHVRNRYLTGKSQGIVFWKYDRLTREPAHFYILSEEMKQHNIKHHCVKEQFEDSAIGRLNRDILLALAAYERENIRLRTRLGKRGRAEIRGEYLGSNKPRYGFDFKDQKRGKLVTNEKEAKVVVDIFTMRSQRKSINGIAKSLNDRGISSPNGKIWRSLTVNRILDNGKYLYRGIGVAFSTVVEKEYKDGKVIKKYRKVNEEDLVFLPEGTVPRIISDELYQKAMEVEEVMKQDSPKANKFPKSTLLRSGFLRCGECGSAMVVHNAFRNGKLYPYYVCSSRTNGYNCPANSVSASMVDRVTWRHVLSLVKDVNIVSNAVKEILSSIDSIGNLNSVKIAIEGCEHKLEKLWKDYDKEDDDEMRATIRNKIKEQNKIKKVLGKELTKIGSREADRKIIEAKLQAFIEWAERVRLGENEEVRYDEKRDRLRFLGIQVLVHSEGRGEERVEITTGPKDLMEALKDVPISVHSTR